MMEVMAKSSGKVMAPLMGTVMVKDINPGTQRIYTDDGHQCQWHFVFRRK
jgi:hypothetical protein